MQHQEFSPEALLGPLNEVEKKYAPEKLYVSGDTSYLESGARVSIVGSRKAGSEGACSSEKARRASLKARHRRGKRSCRGR